MSDFELHKYSGMAYESAQIITFSENSFKALPDVDEEMKFHLDVSSVEVHNLTQEEFYILMLTNLPIPPTQHKNSHGTPWEFSYNLLSLLYAASTAASTAASKPFSCKAQTPSIVVPPGEHTASTSFLGCSPLSRISFALPSTA